MCIVWVDFQISHRHAPLYKIVVLVVVERLPHFIDAPIVDPERVFLLLFCHRFWQPGPCCWLELCFSVRGVELVIGVEHLGTDQLTVSIFLGG
ncbi:hypothetical protein D3C86_1779370 [compost metagenome]